MPQKSSSEAGSCDAKSAETLPLSATQLHISVPPDGASAIASAAQTPSSTLGSPLMGAASLTALEPSDETEPVFHDHDAAAAAPPSAPASVASTPHANVSISAPKDTPQQSPIQIVPGRQAGCRSQPRPRGQRPRSPSGSVSAGAFAPSHFRAARVALQRFRPRLRARRP